MAQALMTHEEVIQFLTDHEPGEKLHDALPEEVKEDLVCSYIEKHSHRDLAEMVLQYVCGNKDNLAIDLVDRVEGCL